ncbi:hypothetical protein RFI_22289 [Reticulomyxa filosa]|uniref:Uncharacterized protein n=1 Tax=Reticulomyxa filosa TaxID=46433 RepID=X6MN27_RETFI|nr:hypothetical protein RFI_22289 [Reticulomyxa filosa]|eukprot:ETO15076.1 hypothetical protein RFI_22289 [Reticulomyxa filosa]
MIGESMTTMKKIFPNPQQRQKETRLTLYYHICACFNIVPKTVDTCSSTLRGKHNKLYHLEASPSPTLRDIRPANGSNDEISLDDIKKVIEDKERESEEEAEVELSCIVGILTQINGTLRRKTYFKYLIVVGFCFDVGKQTDDNNDNDLRNRHYGPKISNTIPQLKPSNSNDRINLRQWRQ